MDAFEENLISTSAELQREWIWTKSDQNWNSIAYSEQELVASKVNETLSIISESSRRGKTSIVFAARCNFPKGSFVPWVSENTRSLARSFIDSCDQTELEETLIEQIEGGLRLLRSLKLQSEVDKGGRKTSHKLKVLGKLLGKTMSDSYDKMNEFKRTNIMDLGVLYSLIQLGNIELNWRFILPYLLAFFDDSDFFIRREACLCLISICDRLASSEDTTNIIIKSQTEPLLRDAILPLILSLPTLTPVEQSIDLVDVSYNSLLKLCKLNFRDELEFNLQLSSVLNDYLLPSMSKVQEYPEILIVLLGKLEMVIQLAGSYTLVLSKQIIFTILSTLMDPYMVHAKDVIMKLLTLLKSCLKFYSGEGLEEYKFNVSGCLGVLKRRSDDGEVYAMIDELLGIF